MRPGHFAPDIVLGGGQVEIRWDASMRPGHFAPDIIPTTSFCSTTATSFNEAGAFCPGYPSGAPA